MPSNVRIRYIQETEIPKCPYYVTMTDKFMSGWGKAKGKTNKLVLCAKTYDQAEVVATNAKDRSEMKNVNIRSTKPAYNRRTHLVSLHGITEGDYATWYRKDRPFKEKRK